ncbi:isovaleryl-CoA dehydrogenase [Sorangium cellulosum]|uniref:Isovaleryl-CoA dehydrogenase n=1 Tax=Sorangium cellulosum TaxID=56 RepID=A0A2L0EIF5_SORCE|nr:acyl-CoA dehydrogenase family protein [Sorangium cellulosum]AUX39081.1 isovaleryl-CoA dehydrogenase [Sorangium cellulosum]
MLPSSIPPPPPAAADFGALLERARRIAADVLAPAANATDQAEVIPRENLLALKGAGLLGLATPTRYGGHGAPGRVAREYTEILAGACGVTAFVQMQHTTGACPLIARGENEALKERVLPRLASGERFCTVGFSHVRRPGPPMVRAELDGDQVLLDGTVPWLTGHGLADDAVLAGTLPDGRVIFVLSSLREVEAIQPSPPLRLCAMNASATVSLRLRGLRVGREQVIATLTREQQTARDAAGMLAPAALSLGVAGAAAALLAQAADRRGSAALASAARGFAGEIDDARAEVNAWADQPEAAEYGEHAVRARAWCIELGVRTAHAAVAASGGSANLLEHTAQRLFREAMLYSLTAQTRDLQAATVQRLVGRGEEGRGQSGKRVDPA